MLSVIIITKNEAKNIRRCLQSVSWADEIIVLDAGSSDTTIDIAKEYTQNVFVTDWLGYGVQKQRALEHAVGDWVLNVDADEVVDELLQQEIRQAMLTATAEAYRIPIRMCFYGKQLRFSSCPKRHIRLFKRERARYSQDIVHEKIILLPQTKVAQLAMPLLHYSFHDLTHAVDKMNKYSSYSANIRRQNEQTTKFLLVFFGSLWMFVRCYILQRGFLDGKEGWILAALNAQGSLYRGLKQLYPDQ